MPRSEGMKTKGMHHVRWSRWVLICCGAIVRLSVVVHDERDLGFSTPFFLSAKLHNLRKSLSDKRVVMVRGGCGGSKFRV